MAGPDPAIQGETTGFRSSISNDSAPTSPLPLTGRGRGWGDELDVMPRIFRWPMSLTGKHAAIPNDHAQTTTPSPQGNKRKPERAGDAATPPVG